MSSFLACSKAPTIEHHLRLAKIECSSQHTESTATESYFYNEASEITAITDSHNESRYEIEYLNSKPSSIFRFIEGELFTRTDIQYSENGNIVSLEYLTPNDSGEFDSGIIYEYSYDEDNRVIERIKYSVEKDEYYDRMKYFWSRDVIIRKEIYFDPSGPLFQEYFYRYDDKKNYKKDIPIYFLDPINWGEHNVTNYEVVEHIFIPATFYRECSYSYIYNLDNYPTEIIGQHGSILKLTYE